MPATDQALAICSWHTCVHGRTCRKHAHALMQLLQSYACRSTHAVDPPVASAEACALVLGRLKQRQIRSKTAIRTPAVYAALIRAQWASRCSMLASCESKLTSQSYTFFLADRLWGAVSGPITALPAVCYHGASGHTVQSVPTSAQSHGVLQSGAQTVIADVLHT